MPTYQTIIAISLLIAFLYFGYRDDYRRLGAKKIFKTMLVVILILFVVIIIISITLPQFRHL
jgi:NADH:ubiquinone oxidoreductase subunit H